jgi:hypothetical protein
MRNGARKLTRLFLHYAHNDTTTTLLPCPPQSLRNVRFQPFHQSALAQLHLREYSFPDVPAP